MRCHRSWGLVAAVLMWSAATLRGVEPAPTTPAKPAQPPAPREHDGVDRPPRIVRDDVAVEGWRVRVDDRLATQEHRELRGRALRLLGDRLYEIGQILPADRVSDLRKVVIVVDLDHGRLTSMQYHPSAEWLREHGYDPAIVRCFHIPDVRRFVDLHHQRVQPWCVLHELAHAYHDQVLGFDHAEVRTTYEAARQAGHYKKVLRITGGDVEHYALKNHHEYFAELTEAYVGTNDFYPFVRSELQAHDPRGYALLEKIWGRLP